MNFQLEYQIKLVLISKANSVKDFKQCDTLQTQVSNLFNEKGMLQAVMKQLLKKGRKK